MDSEEAPVMASSKKKQRIIPPELRKKVARACDSCKRRKQKCNGLLPCELCTAKDFRCEYTSIDRRVLKPSKKQLEERRKMADPQLVRTTKSPTLSPDMESKSPPDSSKTANKTPTTGKNKRVKPAQGSQKHADEDKLTNHSWHHPPFQQQQAQPHQPHYQVNYEPNQQQIFHTEMGYPFHGQNSQFQMGYSLGSQQQQTQLPLGQPQPQPQQQQQQQDHRTVYPAQSQPPTPSLPTNFHPVPQYCTHGEPYVANQSHFMSSSSTPSVNPGSNLNRNTASPVPNGNSRFINSEKSSIQSSLQPLLSFSVNIHPHDDNDECYNEAISSIEDGQNSRVLIDSMGNLCYFGECSPTSYLLQSRKLFHKVLGSNEFSEDPEKSTLVEDKNFDSKKVETPQSIPLVDSNTKLPEKHYADYLLKTYLNNSNNIVYIIDDETLKFHLDRVYSKPNDVSASDLCILNLVFGISSIYARVELSSHILPFSKEKFIDPAVFYKSAVSILSEVEEEGSIWLVEAYLLSFFYLHFSGQRNTAWIKLGLAIRYAQSLGLNRKYVNESLKDPSQVLHRRKIYRSLFIMDRLSAIFLGRSMAISEEDWDDIKSFDTIKDFQDRLFEVCKLDGKILSTVYYNPSISLKKALKLAVELKKQSLENPIKPLTPENYARPMDHRYFLPHICHLHGIILLSRPFFHLIVLNKLGLVQYDRESKNYIHLRNFYQSCVKSSLLIIKIVEYVYHQNIHPFKPLSLTSSTFHAGLIIGLILLLRFKNIDDDVLSNDEEKEVFKDLDTMMIDSMKSAIKMLKSYGEIDNTSRRYGHVLQKMLEVTTVAHSNAENKQQTYSTFSDIQHQAANHYTQAGYNRQNFPVNSIAGAIPGNNQENYQTILKFKDWLYPKLDTLTTTTPELADGEESNEDLKTQPSNKMDNRTTNNNNNANGVHHSYQNLNHRHDHNHHNSTNHSRPDQQQSDDFLKDVAFVNHYDPSRPKFLDDFYFNVLDSNDTGNNSNSHNGKLNASGNQPLVKSTPATNLVTASHGMPPQNYPTHQCIQHQQQPGQFHHDQINNYSYTNANLQ